MGCEESDWQLMAMKTIIKNKNLKKKGFHNIFFYI